MRNIQMQICLKSAHNKPHKNEMNNEQIADYNLSPNRKEDQRNSNK